ncbi:hypothetical protein GEMRC1_000354 [Eukaryota sp. GEM-RC1]
MFALIELVATRLKLLISVFYDTFPLRIFQVDDYGKANKLFYQLPVGKYVTMGKSMYMGIPPMFISKTSIRLQNNVWTIDRSDIKTFIVNELTNIESIYKELVSRLGRLSDPSVLERKTSIEEGLRNFRRLVSTIPGELVNIKIVTHGEREEVFTYGVSDIRCKFYVPMSDEIKKFQDEVAYYNECCLPDLFVLIQNIGIMD